MSQRQQANSGVLKETYGHSFVMNTFVNLYLGFHRLAHNYEVMESMNGERGPGESGGHHGDELSLDFGG